MSGRFADGYDWLPSGASATTIAGLLLAAGYFLRGSTPGALNGAALVTGRFNYGLRLRLQPGSAGFAWQAVVKGIGAQNSAGGFVSAGWNIGANSQQFPFVGVYDLVNDQVLCAVRFSPNGCVTAYRGNPASGGTALGSSDINLYNDNADIDVEVFLKVHSTAGEIQVKINTVSVLHLVNVNTQPGANAYFDGICWGDSAASGQTTNYSIDDLRYYDTAGSINNAFLGTRRVQTSFMAGDGATTDFTRSNATLAHWQNLLNQNVDDTLYLFDATVGDFNLSTIQPLVNNPDIAWIQLTSFVRQDDATQRYVKNRLVSAGTTGDGASYATSQSYTADNDTYELDPNTGLQFTPTAYNALQVGTLIYA